MLLYSILFSAIAAAFAGYSDSSSYSSNAISGAGGQGYGYGFSGAGPLPPFPYFDFSSFLTNYFQALQKYHSELAAKGHPYSYSLASTNPDSSASAMSSITFDNPNRIQRNVGQNAYYGSGQGNGYGFSGSFPGGGYGGGYSGSFGGGSGGSYSSASIGPGGTHQTAAVYPANPAIPNVDTRNGGASPSGGGGVYGVFTSSQSASSNIDGKPVNYHQASTTINDNGKVSTYTVHNP